MSQWFKDCWRRYNRSMEPLEFIRLSPFAKWVKYSRVPFKFLLHLALCALVTIMALQRSRSLSPYSLRTFQSWDDRFSPAGAQSVKSFGRTSTFHLYDAEEVRSSMQRVLSVYFDALNFSLDRFQYDRVSPADPIPPVIMQWTSFKQSMSDIVNLAVPFSDATKSDTFYLTNSSDMGPFSGSGPLSATQLNMIRTLQSASLTFRLRNTEITQDSSYQTCVMWVVQVLYSFDARSRISHSTSESPTICSDSNNLPDQLFWLYICAIVCSSTLLIHVFRNAIKTIRVFNQLREQSKAELQDPLTVTLPTFKRQLSALEIKQLDFDELSCWDKFRFFNFWNLLLSLGCVFTIVAASVRLSLWISLQSNIFVAFAALLVWISLTQYLESFKAFYALILTLKIATPHIIKFVIGLLPLYIAYAIFGLCYFSEVSDYFATLDSSTNTLFGLLNGDAVHDIFAALSPPGQTWYRLVVSRLYLYSFISLFMYTVYNMFMSIVSHAFVATKGFGQLFSYGHTEEEVLTAAEVEERAYSDQVSSMSHLLDSILDQPPLEDIMAEVAAEDAAEAARTQGSYSPPITLSTETGPADSFRLQELPLPSRRNTLTAADSSAAVVDLNLFDPSCINMLDKHVEHLQDGLVDELSAMTAAAVQHLTDAAQQPDSLRIRAAHDAECFPCGFADCLDCALRATLLQAFEHTRVGTVDAAEKMFGVNISSDND